MMIMRDRSTSVKPHPVDAVPASGANVLFDMWLVMRATTSLLDAALAPTGLTADEFGVYSVLTSADTLTPTDLATWMSAPPTTVSSYVKRIEARGHVTRERNPNDGRSYVLRLTAEGTRAHAAAVEAFLPVLQRVVDELAGDEPRVRRSLQTMRRAVGAVTST
jgi:DNA-binding MarR family transcriptional regulator